MSDDPKLLFADAEGKVYEHPTLLAMLRLGEELVPPQGKRLPLPPGARLAHLPGRRPVGLDPETGELELLREVTVEGKTFVPHAVGALLPPGYTRTFLPGELKDDGPVLPQWGYTAAAWENGGPVVWALHTDRRSHWHPDTRPPAKEMKDLVEAHRARMSENPLLVQLKTCAQVYGCFTAQNLFMVQDEGAIPVSTFCNAACVGCISDQPEDGPPSSHERMDQGPSAEDMGRLGVYHLENAKGRVMVSFGQGCEGEPLTRWKQIAQAIRYMRERTQRGSININTNASLTKGLSALFDAGLDAVRVSLNSADPELYAAYYRPQGYDFSDVERSIAVAREKGGYLALNLLTFPGVTDREGEVEALCELIAKYQVDQVQARTLAIDPIQYLEVSADVGAGGEPIGIEAMLKAFKKARPGLIIGNFARALNERAAG
jgi:pyruvate-formate lyase-activating enzyme